MATKPTSKTPESRRAARQEDMRERIRASNLLTDIGQIEGAVKEIAKGPDLTKAESVEEAKIVATAWQQTASVKLQANKILLDSKFNLLKKVVPDLKAIELSTDPEKPLVFRDERSLDSHIRSLAETIAAAEGRVAAGSGSEGPVH